MRLFCRIQLILIMSLMLSACDDKKSDTDSNKISTASDQEDQIDNPDDQIDKLIGEDEDPAEPASLAGQLILNAEVSGLLETQELPAITYDMTNDALSIARQLEPGTVGTLNIGISKSQLELTTKDFMLDETSSKRTIADQFGGRVEVNGEFSDQLNKGQMTIYDFQGREGFPTIKSGILLFDLETTSSTVKGDIGGKDIMIADKAFTMKSSYDLFLKDGLWAGKITGTILSDNGAVNFEYDYDTPIISSVALVILDQEGNESAATAIHNGAIVRLKVAVNSNAAPNWVQINWNSPTQNLEGGGSGQSYCKLGSCSDSPRSSEFYENSRGYWTWFRDFAISEYQPSGTYNWQVSVSNTAQLSSRTVAAEVQVANAGVTGAPEIVEATLSTEAGLGAGLGGDVYLRLLAQSESPINWVNLSLAGPEGNIEGGGSGQTFTECSTLSVAEPHLCVGYGKGYWYYERSWNFTNWSPNGVYTLDQLTVKNAGDLTSAPWSALNYSIAGNTVATTPIITNVMMSSYTGFDPLSGTTINPNDCLVDSDVDDPLQLALIITASSSAPIDWLNYRFDGPSGNLLGGGSGINATDLGGNTWQIIFTYSIAEPVNAPEGTYTWNHINVENEGRKASVDYAGNLNFFLKATCP